MAYTNVQKNGIDTNRPALLIDYEFCTGCHACEVSCKRELELEEGQWGIRLFEYGPVQLDTDLWEQVWLPYPTMLCDLCQRRVGLGKLPSCVHNCPAACMQYGTVEELAQHVAYKPMRVLFVPRCSQ